MTTKRFDSHAILVNHYAAVIRSWDWLTLRQAEKEFVEHNDYGSRIIRKWLGSTEGLMPSGKYYTCWTTNQTRSDVRRDDAFSVALERVAEEQGAYIQWEEGDCFVVWEFNEGFDCAGCGYE